MRRNGTVSICFTLVGVGILAACSAGSVTTAAGRTSRSDSPSTTTGPTTTGSTTTGSTTSSEPTTSTTAHLPVVPGAAGSLYAVTRDGDLLTVELSSGRMRRFPIPSPVKLTAPKHLAVLPEGVVVFEPDNTIAAAFPFAAPKQPQLISGMRLLDTAGQRLAAIQPSDVDQSSVLYLYNGRGELVTQVPFVADVAVRGRGIHFAVMGTKVVVPSLQRLDLETGAVDKLGDGQRLIAATETHLIAIPESCGRACRLTSWAADGTTVAEADAPTVNGAPIVDRCLLDPSGTKMAYGWIGKVTEQGEVRVLDIVSNKSTTLYAQEGFTDPAAFTLDGHHLVIPVEFNRGEVVVVPIAAPQAAVRLLLGEQLLALSAGPSFALS